MRKGFFSPYNCPLCKVNSNQKLTGRCLITIADFLFLPAFFER